MKNKFLNNISWIFFGNVIHAILAFLLNIYVARQLSIDNFGLINYSSSLIAFFISIGTFGFNGVITKKFADDEKNASQYLGTAIKIRCTFAVLAMLLLQIIMYVTSPNESLLRVVVLCQSTSIFFGSFDLIMYWFQYKNQAKTVAVLRLTAFTVSAIWRFLVLWSGNNVVFYVIGVVIETVMFAVLLTIAYQRQNNINFRFSISKAKVLLRISYPFIFSAVLVTIYSQTDRIMLKSMVDNAAVATYSISATLAGAISIIPNVLIEGFRPEIMKFKLTDKTMYQRRLRQLYAIVFWLCTAYCIFISIFAKQVILVFYGEKYIAAVPSLALIVWYTSFSYFGGINNLYMIAEEKTKWVQVLTLLGAILNVVLNAILIPIIGIVGAALASLITQIFSNFLLVAIIPSLRGCFAIMIDGIFLKNTFEYQKFKR